jgi:hypothetical protein
MANRVRFLETGVKVHRRPAVGVGARAEGDRLPEAPTQGLVFVTTDGASRFLPLDFPEMPTEAQLHAMPLEQLIRYYELAQPE